MSHGDGHAASFSARPLLPGLPDDYFGTAALWGPYTTPPEHFQDHSREGTLSDYMARPVRCDYGSHEPYDIASAVEMFAENCHELVAEHYHELDGSDTMLAVRQQNTGQRAGSPTVRDSIAGRFGLYGTDLRVRDGMVVDMREPHRPGTPGLELGANLRNARATQNAAGPQLLSRSDSHGSNDLRRIPSTISYTGNAWGRFSTLPIALKASPKFARSHLPPSSSASSLASETTALTWPQINGRARPALTIRTRPTASCGDLPDQLARALSALHGADSEKRTAIRLELELLLLDFGHLGLSHRDPVLGHDLRRVLASLEVTSKPQLCSASSDDIVRWGFKMAQDAGPATRDRRQYMLKPSTVGTSYTRSRRPTTICQTDFAEHNHPQRPKSQKGT